MQDNTRLLIDIVWQASRFLRRDYFELENLQSSGKNNDLFCNKACTKLAENLRASLGKYYQNIIFSNDEAENLNFTDKIVLVEILDSFSNFKRAMPFFATMVTILVKKGKTVVAEKCIINFPALAETYYAEKGKGCWLEKHQSNFSGEIRARVSGTKMIEDSTIALSSSLFNAGQKITNNIRVFESYAYKAVLVATGKIDACLFPSRSISSLGVSFFINEAGGLASNNDNIIIASNYHIHDKIKHLYQSNL